MNKFFAFCTIILLISTTACNDNFSTDTSSRLDFSADTLRFDTVFTTIGSATACIMVYNNNKQKLQISSVQLKGGAASPFHINFDGATNAINTITDVEIGANDSLYLFVKVNIDPTNQNSPVLVTDQITFLTNGNAQIVQLEAYGQDVEIFRQKYIVNDTTLLGEKPYLVYDYVAIDTAKTLTLNPGCRFYFHDNAQFVVFGTLKAKGTQNQPIIMRGDRLDNLFIDVPYNYVAGKWDGLYLVQPEGVLAAQHEMNYVEINSGSVGIYLENTDTKHLPMLTLHNAYLHNFSAYGLVVQNADIEVINTEISNCANYSVHLSGGDHTFIHSTIAGYFDNTNVMIQSVKKEDVPSFYINELSKQAAPMRTQLINCVIMGSRKNNFTLASPLPNFYAGIFSHNYLRCDSLNLPQFTNNVYYQKNDTVFKNTYFEMNIFDYYNFELDSVSPARGIADPIVAQKYPLDRKGRSRLADGAPDAGAYEWQGGE